MFGRRLNNDDIYKKLVNFKNLKTFEINFKKEFCSKNINKYLCDLDIEDLTIYNMEVNSRKIILRNTKSKIVRINLCEIKEKELVEIIKKNYFIQNIFILYHNAFCCYRIKEMDNFAFFEILEKIQKRNKIKVENMDLKNNYDVNFFYDNNVF